MQPQTEVAPRGILPYYFLHDYQNYSTGDVAGLKIDLGDRIAATKVDTAHPDGTRYQTYLARRATPEDLARWHQRGRKKAVAPEPLVPVQFKVSYGPYRGPSADKPADIAGFPAAKARQLCEGFLSGDKKVGAVADYYIPPEAVNEDLEIEKPRKPRKPRRPRAKKKVASMDEQGAPEKK